MRCYCQFIVFLRSWCCRQEAKLDTESLVSYALVPGLSVRSKDGEAYHGDGGLSRVMNESMEDVQSNGLLVAASTGP